MAATKEEGRRAAAKGLLGVEEADEENGFEDPELEELVENGLAEEEADDDFAPNRVSPKLVVGFAACFSALSSVFEVSFLSFATVILTPRKALTLPSFRLHVFRRHDSTYNRLSCPGKNSGRSPFSWRRRTMRSLHTLHFARVADGGVDGSSHSYI